jgi:hypothetical protein
VAIERAGTQLAAAGIVMAHEHQKTHTRDGELGLAETAYPRLESEVDDLRLLREEMRVQLDLAATEAGDLSQPAEDRWRA